MHVISQEFEIFMQVLEERLHTLGIVFSDYPIDHVCYRVANISEFENLQQKFMQASLLCTKKFFHERTFLLFVLRKPFVYKEFAIPYLEFAQPGGSDSYARGFQHIEFHTNKHIKALVKDTASIQDLLCVSKHGDETYLKWPDKVCLKVTAKPIITKALLDDNPKIFLNS